ncbi:unnamed protein product, partial [Hapterophycus canaliculatus]
GQNYNGLYIVQLSEASLCKCSEGEGAWRLKTTCSSNWAEQKAIADGVHVTWSQSSLEERLHYGGRSDATLVYVRGAQANLLSNKKKQ